MTIQFNWFFHQLLHNITQILQYKDHKEVTKIN